MKNIKNSMPNDILIKDKTLTSVYSGQSEESKILGIDIENDKIKYTRDGDVWEEVASGGGDVSASGDNTFTGLNSFEGGIKVVGENGICLEADGEPDKCTMINGYVNGDGTYQTETTMQGDYNFVSNGNKVLIDYEEVALKKDIQSGGGSSTTKTTTYNGEQGFVDFINFLTSYSKDITSNVIMVKNTFDLPLDVRITSVIASYSTTVMEDGIVVDRIDVNNSEDRAQRLFGGNITIATAFDGFMLGNLFVSIDGNDMPASIQPTLQENGLYTVDTIAGTLMELTALNMSVVANYVANIRPDTGYLLLDVDFTNFTGTITTQEV